MEDFGVFNFATEKRQPTASDDDDDWGDFVTQNSSHPKTHVVSNGFTSSKPPTPPQKPAADPFGFLNIPNGKNGSPPPGSGPTRPGKARGALPMSFFGEEENEEEEEETTVKKKKGSNLSLDLDLDVDRNKDVILYVISPKVMVHKRSNSYSGPDSSLNGSDLKVGGLNSSSSGSDLKLAGLNNGSGSDSGQVKSNLEQRNGDFDEDDDDDDDGWEFKAAESQYPVKNFEEQGVVEVAGSKVESNALRGIQENAGATGISGGFGIQSQEFSNLSVPSNGTSHGNSDWGFSFDFKPSPVTQDDFFLETYSKTKQNVAASVSGSSLVDDNMWEFKDAIPKSRSEHKLEEAKAAAPAGLEWGTSNGSGAHNDFFAGSDWIPHQSPGNNFSFPFISNSGSRDCVILDSYSSGTKAEFSCPPDINNVESDDNFWEFKDAFSESGSKIEGGSVVDGNSPTDEKPSAMGCEVQHNEVTLENHRPPLPLSIFGDEELETDDSSVHQDIAAHQINTFKNSASNISITDLMSLYSQVEQNTSTVHASRETENTMHHAATVLEADFGGDDVDDDSWEFKDAASKDQDLTSVADHEDLHKNSCTKMKLDDFLNLYCKLKDELYFLARYHLDNKKAQSSPTLSGEDTMEALDEEIQKLYYEQHQDNMLSGQSGSASPRNAGLNELREVLQEPKFQVLESEYQLLQRLSLAEKDLRSAIELLRHAASILRILKTGSTEEQLNYISAWSQMVSICAEELRHGSIIWKQLLEKKVQKQILSEPQVKQYFIALGEIYRVALVLGASTKLYNPWILLHSSDCSSLLVLLNECSSIWSSLGLDEVLRSLSDTDDIKYDGTVNALLDSLTYIQHLDSFSLQNHVLSGDQPICSLSLLTPGAVPGIKMVLWNEEHCLLTLANLWINLVGCDAPQLPHFSFR